MIIEIAGQEGKVEAFIEMMRPFGIIELVRTGRIALVRGKSANKENGVATGAATGRELTTAVSRSRGRGSGQPYVSISNSGVTQNAGEDLL